MVDNDTDLIAYLYPSGLETNVFLHGGHYVPAESRAPPASTKSLGPGEREGTESLDDEPGEDALPRVELRFSRGPKSTRGFVFGRHDGSDVVLADRRGISSCHFIITFDEHNRLVVKDPGSTVGTDVVYERYGYQKDRRGMRRKNFQWIVGGGQHPCLKDGIVIQLTGSVKFRIVVSTQDTESEHYVKKVEKFRRGSGSTEDLFQKLAMPPDTEHPTGTHTPGSEAIFLKEHIGRGTFGSVTHLWNVSTGEEKVIKEPSGDKYDSNDWKREAEILKRVNHDHIVKFLAFEETPKPQLYLEYVPGKTLAQHKDISTRECAKISQQLLSALEYLHGFDKPLLHRDIKPGNILVQYRDKSRDHLLVKFGDFGLSKEPKSSGGWDTICGTSRYMAPEMINMYCTGVDDRYTAAVDIWSLGVVLYGLLWELPKWKSKYQYQPDTYSRMVLDSLQQDLKRSSKEKLEILQFLSKAMLLTNPASRWSAKDCHHGARKLSLAPTGKDPVPPSSSQLRQEEATLRPGEHGNHMDPQTAIQHTAIREPVQSSKSTLARPQMLRIAKRSPQRASAQGRRSKRVRHGHDANQHSTQPDEESTEQEESSSEQEDEASTEPAIEASTQQAEESSARETESQPTLGLSEMRSPRQVLQALEGNDALDSFLVGSFLSELGGRREFSSSLKSQPRTLAGGTSQSRDGPPTHTTQDQARGDQPPDTVLGEEEQPTLQWAIQFSD